MSKTTTENMFETATIQTLVESNGCAEGNVPDYSPELGMFAPLIFKD